MILIDYPFYRFYMWERKRGETHKDSVINASIFATTIFILLTPGIWVNLLLLLFKDSTDLYLIVFFVVLYVLYKRYKKICSQLCCKYKKSIFNKIIPDVCIPLFIFLYIIIGLAIAIPMNIYLENKFERGEWGDYLLSLFS